MERKTRLVQLASRSNCSYSRRRFASPRPICRQAFEKVASRWWLTMKNYGFEEKRPRRRAVRVVLGAAGPLGNSLTALNCNCSVRRIPSWPRGPWGPRKNADSSVNCNSFTEGGSCRGAGTAAGYGSRPGTRHNPVFLDRRVNKFHRRADRMPGTASRPPPVRVERFPGSIPPARLSA